MKITLAGININTDGFVIAIDPDDIHEALVISGNIRRVKLKISLEKNRIASEDNICLSDVTANFYRVPVNMLENRLVFETTNMITADPNFHRKLFSSPKLQKCFCPLYSVGRNL